MRMYVYVVVAMGVTVLGMYGLTWVEAIDNGILAFLFGTACFTVPTVVWLWFIKVLERW